MYVYIYIYIYTYMCIYIYIYIHITIGLLGDLFPGIDVPRARDYDMEDTLTKALYTMTSILLLCMCYICIVSM